jgi:hypothetical protein
VEDHPFKAHIEGPAAQMFDTLGRHSSLLYRMIFANMWCFGWIIDLLGKTSGGGSCVVGFNTTAWGTSYQYSSPKRLAFVKNGAYYDVDQGVEPDHVIDSYDHFYDREALTEFIHGLY